jgi:uncharacterized membrane protein
MKIRKPIEITDFSNQTGRVYRIMKLRNGKWVDAMTFVRLSKPILRYSACIYNLREMGYKIETRIKKGRSWAEYKINL